MEAANVTGELNPLAGVTVKVEIPVEPAVTATAAALNVKLGGGTAAVTVNAIVAPALNAPLVPVTASAYAPGTTAAPTLIVTPEAPKAP